MAGEVADHDGAIKKVIHKLVEKDFKRLYDRFKQDSKLDIEIDFLFHYACRSGRLYGTELDFIEAVINECLDLGKDVGSKECLHLEGNGERVLKYLFERKNSQGYVPFLLAIEDHGESYLKAFLEKMPPASNPSYSTLLNACDIRGWSPIHMIVTRYTTHEILKKLVKEKIDVNATLPSSKATALHLAIYHDRPEAVKIILEADSDSVKVAVNAILERNIIYGSKCKNGENRSSRYWSPLQLAAIMGRADVVRILLTKVCYISTTICRSFFITRIFSLFTNM